MNIFVTHPSPRQCAIDLDDRRLIKMVLETAQLLCTAARRAPELMGIEVGDHLYRSTHDNHPCAIWVRQNLSQAQWTVSLWDFLMSEYTHRFGKVHASSRLMPIFAHLSIDFNEPPATFANCSRYKAPEINVHNAYRLTLRDKWEEDAANGRPPTWRGRGMPRWAGHNPTTGKFLLQFPYQEIDQ